MFAPADQQVVAAWVRAHADRLAAIVTRAEALGAFGVVEYGERHTIAVVYVGFANEPEADGWGHKHYWSFPDGWDLVGVQHHDTFVPDDDEDDAPTGRYRVQRHPNGDGTNTYVLVDPHGWTVTTTAEENSLTGRRFTRAELQEAARTYNQDAGLTPATALRATLTVVIGGLNPGTDSGLLGQHVERTLDAELLEGHVDSVAIATTRDTAR
jgi:hypothetical protein